MSKLERTTPESVGIHSEAILKLMDTLENCDLTEMHGIMIARHGKVCAEGWWNPYTPGRHHISWSLGKTYTATAVGIAITEGYLSLENRLIDIFPEYAPENPSENLKMISVHHLLSMSGGMKLMSPEGEGWLEKFINTPVEREPGTAMMYNSMGTNTLAAIVRKVTGRRMEDYLKEKLYGKIGIDADNTFWTIIPDDYEWGAGGVYTTTEDNLRLMMLYLQNGEWNGERILSEDYIHRATSPQIGTAIAYAPDGKEVRRTSPDGNSGYGYQMWMCGYPGAYRAAGAQGQSAVVFPNEDMVVSVHQTCDDSNVILGFIYEKLMPGVSKYPLPENQYYSDKLRHKLKKLSLPMPACSPKSSVSARISGKQFEVTGAFTLLTAFEPREYMGTGIRISTGISQFSLTFSTTTCDMRYTENGEVLHAEVALDGSRARNIINVPRHTPTEVLLSGAWVEDHAFEIKARWIESTVEKTIRFTFGDADVEITAELTTGRLGGYPSAPESASGHMKDGIN